MLSETLQEIIEDGDLLRLFLGPQQKSIHRSIDFGKAPPKHDMQNNTYRILLHNNFVPNESKKVGSVSATKDVVCLFPNHTNKNKRILESKRYTSRDEFNKELNARFADSPEQTEQFKDHRLLILYGAHCFICSKLTGTVYILWAERVAKINASNTSTIPYVNVPIVFNLNRLNKIKCMYLLRPQIDNKPNDLALFPLTQGNPILMYNTGYNPFVCEERPDQLAKKKIHVISQEEAQVMVMQSTQDTSEWLPFEQLPFSQLEDQGMVEIEPQNAITHVPWTQSPRELFLDSSPRLSGGGGGGVGGGGLLIRDTQSVSTLLKKQEPDPFAETTDDELSCFSRGVEIDLADL